MQNACNFCQWQPCQSEVGDTKELPGKIMNIWQDCWLRLVLMTETWQYDSLVSGTGAMLARDLIPANTKHLFTICAMLDQRRRRWADVVRMLYKCFVLAGMLARANVADIHDATICRFIFLFILLWTTLLSHRQFLTLYIVAWYLK